jgi:hypothetical protein
MRPTVTRQQYRAFAATAAGWEWDRMQAEDAERDADAQAMRDAEAERIAARYARDCAEQRAREDATPVADPFGGGIERRQAAVLAVCAERDAAAARTHAKRMRTPPCERCGYAAGHGHADDTC